MSSHTEPQEGSNAFTLRDAFAHHAKRPQVVITEEAIIHKIEELRLALTKALAILAVRDKVGRTVPDDIVRLILRELSVTDLMSACHVCQQWRAIALDTTDLWARLDIHASPARLPWYQLGDQDEPVDDIPPITNLGVIPHLIPRSRNKPLTLNVTFQLPDVPQRVIDQLCHILDLASDRLATLTLNTDDLLLVERLFCNNVGNLPALRDLSIDVSGDQPDDPRRKFDFDQMRMPTLRSLSFPHFLRLQNPQRLESLQSFSGATDGLLGMEAMLFLAPGLRSLTWDIQPDEFGSPGDASLPYMVDMMSSIPAVVVRTSFSVFLGEDVVEIFADFHGRSLVLEVDCDLNPLKVKLFPCAWMRTATRLEVQGSAEAIDLVFADDANGRTVTIRLFEQRMPAGLPSNGIVISWEFVPSLDALTDLDVDIAAWRRAMGNFPEAPQLRDTTIWLPNARSLDHLLEYPDPDDEGRLARYFPLPTSIPDVPAGSALTLVFETPGDVLKSRVEELIECLNADGAFLEGAAVVDDQ